MLWVLFSSFSQFLFPLIGDFVVAEMVHLTPVCKKKKIKLHYCKLCQWLTINKATDRVLTESYTV